MWLWKVVEVYHFSTTWIIDIIIIHPSLRESDSALTDLTQVNALTSRTSVDRLVAETTSAC